ncbi:MAG: MerR family DNA-binding protein [Chloroflexota bacterium]|nr:MerR family DNA-binding protein [Chloroflexota bacterium]
MTLYRRRASSLPEADGQHFAIFYHRESGLAGEREDPEAPYAGAVGPCGPRLIGERRSGRSISWLIPTAPARVSLSDRERLRFIAKAKAIGLTLEEIGEILRLREGGEQPCKHVVELLDSKIAQVDRYLRALSDFRQELVGLREEAAENATDEAHYCRIIERHEGAQHDEHLLSGLIQAPRKKHRG